MVGRRLCQLRAVLSLQQSACDISSAAEQCLRVMENAGWRLGEKARVSFSRRTHYYYHLKTVSVKIVDPTFIKLSLDYLRIKS